MGSYFGEDYTASTLVRLGVLTKQEPCEFRGDAAGHQGARQQVARGHRPGRNAARADHASRPHRRPKRSSDAAVTATMQKQLQGIDLTQTRVVLPDAVAKAIRALQGELTTKLNTVNLSAGWVPAKSLDPALRLQTADFIIYSAMTTVARRPDHPNTSWTENWPFEPSVGNTPTTNTFHWTWISFCFTFFSMGFVLWLYRAYLDHPDDAPMERGLATLSRADAEPGQDRQILHRRRAGVPRLAGGGRDHGPFLLRPGDLLRHPAQLHPAVQLPAQLPPAGADHLDRPRLDRERPVHRPGDRRRARGEGPGLPGRSACSGSRCSSSPPRCSAITSASRA